MVASESADLLQGSLHQTENRFSRSNNKTMNMSSSKGAAQDQATLDENGSPSRIDAKHTRFVVDGAVADDKMEAEKALHEIPNIYPMNNIFCLSCCPPFHILILSSFYSNNPRIQRRQRRYMRTECTGYDNREKRTLIPINFLSLSDPDR